MAKLIQNYDTFIANYNRVITNYGSFDKKLRQKNVTNYTKNLFNKTKTAQISPTY